MKKIKGSLFKAWAIAIRANKTGIYDDLISEEDKQVISQRILDAAWYPFDTFKRCIIAVCKVEARGNLRIIEKWSYDYGKTMIERTYNSPMNKKDLNMALNSYNRLFNLWFNFGRQYGEIISENEIHVIIDDFDKDFEVFYNSAKGWMASFFEMYLSTRVTTSFIEKSWNGANKTSIKITWNS
ncbi:MAG: hypothetical protein ACFFAT_08800 [Promethearchaeota archaeon]